MALSSSTDRANIVFSGVSNTYLRNSGIKADAKLIIRYCVDSLGELVVLISLEKNWHLIYKIYACLVLMCADITTCSVQLLSIYMSLFIRADRKLNR